MRRISQDQNIGNKSKNTQWEQAREAVSGNLVRKITMKDRVHAEKKVADLKLTRSNEGELCATKPGEEKLEGTQEGWKTESNQIRKRASEGIITEMTESVGQQAMRGQRVS